TAVSYRVSPYIQGVTGGNINYLVRLNSVWGNYSGTPISASNSNYTEWLFNLASPVAPWGWAAEGDRTVSRFTDQKPQVTQLVRLRAIYDYGPQLEGSGSIG